jgi:signal transduction histidine kinase
MLELYNNGEEKTKKYIDLTKQNSYRLLRLINNLLDLNKIENNSFNLDKQNINIVELVKKLYDSIKPHTQNKNKILKFNSDMESKIIACDPYKIERAILNLLSNAIKFTDETDTITISVREQNENILITVEDTGIGINESDKEIIFEEFGQIDKSLARNHEGTGLGLSIVKSIIELHDGTVSLKSEDTKGSKFTIKLPNNILKDQEIDHNYKEEIDSIKLELSDIT